MNEEKGSCDGRDTEDDSYDFPVSLTHAVSELWHSTERETTVPRPTVVETINAVTLISNPDTVLVLLASRGGLIVYVVSVASVPLM